MHKMGIATSVLDAAQKEAERHPVSKLLKVGLRIGEWPGVGPDSLRFCFEALVLCWAARMRLRSISRSAIGRIDALLAAPYLLSGTIRLIVQSAVLR
jgi:hypothetical protein